MKRVKKTIGALAVAGLLCLPAPAYGFKPFCDSAQVAAAFMTNLALHEVGHAAVGTYVGAQGTKTSFFGKKNGSFFLGYTQYSEIKKEARLPFLAGGAMMNGYAFEYALADHRRSPNTYNKALMLFSCTDFLYYSLYAFYLAPENSNYDPVAIKRETGLGQETILGLALTQSLLNGMRAFDVQDRVVPYVQVDRYWASFNLRITF